MKKILLLLFIPLLILASGCRKEEPTPGTASGQGVAMSVKFNIPAVRPASRAIVTSELTSGMIDEAKGLWLMVFNENGNFLSRHRGTPVGGSVSNYTFAEVQVTEQARRLHFVANYDWSGFRDADAVGRPESEVMTRMHVSDGATAYWQRVELPAGELNLSDGDTYTIAENVHLLRNVVQIKVINNTSTDLMHLTDVTFAVGNRLDMGFVAPYDTRSREFWNGDPEDSYDPYLVSEPAGGTTIPIDHTDSGESDFVSTEAGEAIDIYERRNSEAAQQTYIIVKGYFQGDGEESNTTTPSYYKLDICDTDATELPDLCRNFCYTISINNVSHPGYATLKEAMDGSSANNINASVTASEYTVISDGQFILRIDGSAYTFIEPGKEFSIGYAYIDASTGATDNSGIRIELVEQDPTNPVLAEFDDGTPVNSGAEITIKTASTLPDRGFRRAAINISKGNLSRTINLRLRQPMALDISTYPEDGIVPNRIGESVSISFKMPNDISPTLFPIPIYINSKLFSPDVVGNEQSGYGGGLSVTFHDGEFWYVYNAPYLGNDEFGEPIAHRLYFLSNSPNTNETIEIASDLFKPSEVQFGNLDSGSPNEVLNLQATPNPVAARVGEEVTLSFDLDWNETPKQHTFRIYTAHLREYVSSADPLATCVWNDEFGCWLYTPGSPEYISGAVRQSVTFRTTAADSGERVRVAATGFFSTNILRTCIMLSFEGTRLNPAAPKKAIDQPVDILLAIPDNYDWAANDNKCVVTFHTQNTLVPFADDGELVAVSEAEHGAGYQFTVTGGPGTRTATAHFKTLTQGSDIRVSVHAPGFNTLDITGTRANWAFTASFDTKPRTLANANPTTVRFTLEDGSVSEQNPVTVIFRAPWLDLVANDDANRSPSLAGGAITAGTAGANMVMTMTVTTAGEHYFRVRNNTGADGNNGQERQRREMIKTFEATDFDNKTVNNPTGD